MKKRECPSCAMEIDKNEKVCPICGYEFPLESSLLKPAIIILVILFILFILNML